MIDKRFLALLIVFTVLHGVKCQVKVVSYNTTTYITCTPANASSESKEECPENSQCIEIMGYGSHIKADKNMVEGLCNCKKDPKLNMKVNPKFNSTDNTSIYCIEDTQTTVAPPTTPSTSAPTTTSTTKAPVVSSTTPKTVVTSTVPPQKPTAAPKVDTTTAKASNKSDVDVKPVPEPSRSIFASIFVPVMIVLGLISVIFVARKYNMVDRTRNYIRNRGGQQHQTRYDGLENDFDDDPLLI